MTVVVRPTARDGCWMLPMRCLCRVRVAQRHRRQRLMMKRPTWLCKVGETSEDTGGNHNQQACVAPFHHALPPAGRRAVCPSCRSCTASGMRPTRAGAGATGSEMGASSMGVKDGGMAAGSRKVTVRGHERQKKERNRYMTGRSHILRRY